MCVAVVVVFIQVAVLHLCNASQFVSRITIRNLMDFFSHLYLEPNIVKPKTDYLTPLVASSHRLLSTCGSFDLSSPICHQLWVWPQMSCLLAMKTVATKCTVGNFIFCSKSAIGSPFQLKSCNVWTLSKVSFLTSRQIHRWWWVAAMSVRTLHSPRSVSQMGAVFYPCSENRKRSEERTVKTFAL